MSAIAANDRASALDLTTIVAVVVTIVAWASAFPAIRAGLAAFGPAELGSVRFSVAAIPAAIFLAVTRPKLPSLKESWRFLYGGIVFVAFYTTLLNFGEVTVSAGAASFIINVAPIIVAIMATFTLGERFSRLAWLGTFISFAGIGLIALGEGNGLEINRGALLILGAAFCTASTAVVQKPLFRSHKPLTVSASNMVIGAIALLPLALLWFGLGNGSVLFVLAHSVLWPFALNTHAGYLAVSETLKLAGRNCGLSPIAYVARVLMPAALPSIIAGLKISWAFGWRTLIAAELVFGASSAGGGIGWFIFEKRNDLRIPDVFAGLLVIVIIGLFVDGVLFRYLEKVTVRRWGMVRSA